MKTTYEILGPMASNLEKGSIEKYTFAETKRLLSVFQNNKSLKRRPWDTGFTNITVVLTEFISPSYKDKVQNDHMVKELIVETRNHLKNGA